MSANKKLKMSSPSISADILKHKLCPFLPLDVLVSKISPLSKEYNSFVSENYDKWLEMYLPPFWSAYKKERNISAKETIKFVLEAENELLGDYRDENPAEYHKMMRKDPWIRDFIIFWQRHHPLMWMEFCGVDTSDGVDYLGNISDELTEGEPQVLFSVGNNGSGSMHCLWKRNPEESPLVVLLGDEGELGVIARNMRDFVRIVGSGMSDPGFMVGGHQLSDVEHAPTVADIQSSIEDNLQEEMDVSEDESNPLKNFHLFQKCLSESGQPAFTAEEMSQYWKDLMERDELTKQFFTYLQIESRE